jgi:hypothetical protein
MLLGWIIDDPVYVDRLPVIVYVHGSIDAMHDWYRAHDREVEQGGWEWDAVTSSRIGDHADPDLGDCFEIHFAKTRLWYSIIAHEATHVGLLMYAHHHLRKHRRARAWKHVQHHTEQIPETVGNLTAHLIVLLQQHYPDDFGKEE